MSLYNPVEQGENKREKKTTLMHSGYVEERVKVSIVDHADRILIETANYIDHLCSNAVVLNDFLNVGSVDRVKCLAEFYEVYVQQ